MAVCQHFTINCFFSKAIQACFLFRQGQICTFFTTAASFLANIPIRTFVIKCLFNFMYLAFSNTLIKSIILSFFAKIYLNQIYYLTINKISYLTNIVLLLSPSIPCFQSPFSFLRSSVLNVSTFKTPETLTSFL